MSEENHIYIRLRHRLKVKQDQVVYLKDIAQYIAPPSLESKLAVLPVHKVKRNDKHLIVIDIMKVMSAIKSVDSQIEIEALGQPQIILEIEYEQKSPRFILVVFVWLLLFIGSGLAIMNFHEDVSMLEVHQRLYKMLTGIEEEQPLLLQIPYSVGIGLGMILFFNHVFKKRLNEEPSPLEVEMFNYQESLNRYVSVHENKEEVNSKSGRSH